MLRKMLAATPRCSLSVFTEKLMTYALGRGVEYYDMPTIRAIVRDAGDRRLQVFVHLCWALSRARRSR